MVAQATVLSARDHFTFSSLRNLPSFVSSTYIVLFWVSSCNVFDSLRVRKYRIIVVQPFPFLFLLFHLFVLFPSEGKETSVCVVANKSSTFSGRM